MKMKNNCKWIELLEAIDEAGSINKATSILGVTYKAVYKRLQSLKNAYPHLHLVNSEIGGIKRGGTYLTTDAYKLIEELKNENN